MLGAVFLDLNGTLVLPVLVQDLAELKPIPGAARAVSQLNRAGYRTPVVTIQSRIAKGHFSLGEFMDWFQGLTTIFQEEGARLEGPYVCPHRFADPCPCKKPNPLLYEQAARDCQVSLPRSYTVGDTQLDLDAAHRFGGFGCLVLTGETRSHSASSGSDFVGDTLGDVADWILARSAG
jgi:D-glycero-D-manno-heptose 1,7-bisphosphate phosphatase